MLSKKTVMALGSLTKSPALHLTSGAIHSQKPVIISFRTDSLRYLRRGEPQWPSALPRTPETTDCWHQVLKHRKSNAMTVYTSDEM